MMMNCALMIASVGTYLSGLLERLTEGHFMTWEEAAHVEKVIMVCGFVFEITALEAAVMMGLMMMVIGLTFYLLGRSEGIWKGRSDCDIEWWESIEKEYERLKKYGFGDREANDRAAVRTYKEMVEKRTRKD